MSRILTERYEELKKQIGENTMSELYECANDDCNNIQFSCRCDSECYYWKRSTDDIDWFSCESCNMNILYCMQCKDKFLFEIPDNFYNLLEKNWLLCEQCLQNW